MEDCPTIQELAAYVEGSSVSAAVLEHVPTCRACRASLSTLQGEVQTLQISISELWFREKVSCPDDDVLRSYEQGALDAALLEYVTFHVEDLACPYCQAQLGEFEVSRDQVEVKRRKRSREKVGEATAYLLKQLRK